MFVYSTILFHICVVHVFLENFKAIWPFCLELHFLNKTMEKIEHDPFRYSDNIVTGCGILGNILVILTIVRQKNGLKNNYYFLVLQLTICDLIVLIPHLYDFITYYCHDAPLPNDQPSNIINCVVFVINLDFLVAGTGIMLIISVLRFRAVVHPLKPAISRKKLKTACVLVHIVGLIVAGGTRLPLCFIKSTTLYYDAFWKFYYACKVFFVSLGPTIFMAVVYYKIGRALIKQKRVMKRVCPNQVRRLAPSSTYIRNRKTFLVCVSTVLCFGVGNIPASVLAIWFIVGPYHKVMDCSFVWNIVVVLGIAFSHSVNPIIYGILDKQLLTFCCKRKRRR